MFFCRFSLCFNNYKRFVNMWRLSCWTQCVSVINICKAYFWFVLHKNIISALHYTIVSRLISTEVRGVLTYGRLHTLQKILFNWAKACSHPSTICYLLILLSLILYYDHTTRLTFPSALCVITLLWIHEHIVLPSLFFF